MAENPFSGQPAKRSTAEFRLHIAVVEHLRSAFPHVLFTHPAQKAKDAQEGHFNKMLGVRRGVPDLLLWWSTFASVRRRVPAEISLYEGDTEWSEPNNRLLEAGAIELKSGKGKQSGYQANFEEVFKRIGGKHAYCRSVQEVHNTLVSWGIEPKHNAVVEPDLRSDQQKKGDAYSFYAFDPRN